MAKRKVPGNTSEFLDQFSKFLGDASGQSLTELEDELRNLGIDPDAVVQRVENLVASSLEANRLAWQEKARSERECALRWLAQSRLPSRDEEDLKEQVSGLLASLSKQGAVPGIQAYWSKFEKATEQDLRVLLEDLQRLDVLLRLKKGDDNDRP
jgi:hypothetical protein